MGGLASCGPRRLRYRVSKPSPCGVYRRSYQGVCFEPSEKRGWFLR